jgi:hypothetical protein
MEEKEEEENTLPQAGCGAVLKREHSLLEKAS